MSDIAKLIDQPGGYRLSEGVYATRDGLFFSGNMSDLLSAAVIAWDYPADHSFQCGHLFPWDTAAERLRYQEGQPWCRVKSKLDIGIECLPGSPHERLGTMPHRKEKALDRFAAILCDDAFAFRVLYWCITELGEEDES